MSASLPPRPAAAETSHAPGFHAPGSQRPRPVVALDCGTADALLPGACDALRAALRGRVPGAVQRRMDDLSAAPARPGDLALALVVDGATLRLDWRGADGAMRAGPRAAIPATPTDAAATLDALLDALPRDFF